ncbi:hypothetical protein [Williamsia sp. D3]|uniref:hypothetical protein n=1 Tax=Williamsia sp. D3 TaxID=1313067 RepID=UPI0003D31F09|nr:hypothetical protein [Williamsia sp. D3]ETD31515.1 hypothetical protein W823_19175 [Williamsia sp. D3]
MSAPHLEAVAKAMWGGRNNQGPRTAANSAADSDDWVTAQHYWIPRAADAIREFTKNGPLPAPDITDADHGNFVRDWFGQVSDEELGGERQWTDGAEGLGELVRGRGLDLIDKIEERGDLIETVAEVMHNNSGTSAAWPSQYAHEYRARAKGLLASPRIKITLADGS